MGQNKNTKTALFKGKLNIKNEVVKYNIVLFKLKNKEDGYKHFFVFLIRYFFNSNDFSGRITKKEFIEKGFKKGFTKRNLENIYQKGKKENKFLNEVKNNKNQSFITVKTFYNKEKSHHYFGIIDKKIIEKVKGIKEFKDLCYAIIASRPLLNNGDKKLSHIKNSGRILSTIGRNFGNSSKTVMSKRLIQSEKTFKGYFQKKSRYYKYNGFLAQISNWYSFNGVEYKSYRNANFKGKAEDKNIEKNDNINNKKEFKKNKYITPQKVRDKSIIFGDNNGKNKGFLSADLYEDLYPKILEDMKNNYN